MQKALITGIRGQDGSYLAELLLSKGYEVHGLVRQDSIEDPEHKLTNIKGILNEINLHTASIEDYPNILKIIREVQPNECYHLAAKSFVNFSFDSEFSTLSNNINGTYYILSAIKEAASNCKFYFAGSSEMFGDAKECPQNESTSFQPRSAYGISKVAGFHLTENYRNQYGLFACSGILYNHESPRRSYEFVTRKIVSHAVKIKRGKIKELRLGNLEAKRDWGYAKDYVNAMWLMLQNKTPMDYVIASGKLHTVRDFVAAVFERLDLDYRKFVIIDNRFFRPMEKIPLQGDSKKARAELGWKPGHSFEELIDEMVEYELRS